PYNSTVIPFVVSGYKNSLPIIILYGLMLGIYHIFRFLSTRVSFGFQARGVNIVAQINCIISGSLFGFKVIFESSQCIAHSSHWREPCVADQIKSFCNFLFRRKYWVCIFILELWPVSSARRNKK